MIIVKAIPASSFLCQLAIKLPLWTGIFVESVRVQQDTSSYCCIGFRRPTQLRSSIVIKVFPFSANASRGHELFRQYVSANHEELKQKYGSRVFVGGAEPYVQSWSYYEVDVEVLDLHTVEFTTYGMESLAHGGRGRKKDVIRAAYPGVDLYIIVEERRIQLAKDEHARRKEEAEKAKYEAEVLAIYKEMFHSPLNSL